MLIAGIYLADWNHYVIPSKVPYLLAVAWVSLHLRQLRWRDVGFRLYRDWPTTLAIGVAAGIAMEMLELFFTQPLLFASPGSCPICRDSAEWLAMSGGWQFRSPLRGHFSPLAKS